MDITYLLSKLSNKFPSWFETKKRSILEDVPSSMTQENIDKFMRKILKIIFSYYKNHKKDKFYFDLEDKNYNKKYPNNKIKNDFVIRNEKELNMYDIFLYCIYRDEYENYIEYSGIVNIKIKGINLLRICGTSHKEIFNEDLEILNKYLDRFCMNDNFDEDRIEDENFREEIRLVISKIRKESVFKIILNNICSELDEMRDYDDERVFAEIKYYLEKFYKINRYLPERCQIKKYHDTYIRIGDRELNSIYEIVLEFDELFHEKEIAKDMQRNALAKITYSHFDFLKEKIYEKDVQNFVEKDFIKKYFDEKSINRKKRLIKKYCEKKNLPNDEELHECFELFIEKIDDLKSIIGRENIFQKGIIEFLENKKADLNLFESNKKINDLISFIEEKEMQKKFIKFWKYFLKFTDIQIDDPYIFPEYSREYQIYSYNNFFVNLIEEIFIGSCFHLQDRGKLAQFILSKTDEFKKLNEREKQEHLSTIKKLIELYIKRQKNGYINLLEISYILNIPVETLKNNLKLSIEFNKSEDSEDENNLTNSLEEIILGINKISNDNIKFERIKNFFMNEEINEDEFRKLSKFFTKYEDYEIDSLRIERIQKLLTQTLDCLTISSELLLKYQKRSAEKIADYLPNFIDLLKSNFLDRLENIGRIFT